MLHFLTDLGWKCFGGGPHPDLRPRRPTPPLIEALEPRCLPSAGVDLVPTLVDVPSSAEHGSRLSIMTRVENLGAMDSGRFRVEYRLSRDQIIDDDDLLVTVITRKHGVANGDVEWTQSIRLDRDIVPGEYYIGVTVDPANDLSESDETNNTAVSSQPLTIGFQSLTGQVQFMNARRRADIHLLNPQPIIDVAATTWLVIHGRNQSSASPNLVALASQIDGFQTGDQVLMLDWRKAARSGRIGGQGEDFIRPVATWAASALASYGLTGEKLNLVGYSWGAEVAGEMAEIFGQVNSILAMDAARDFPGGSYNPEATGEIDFAGHANQSWAFFASTSFPFGSAPIAATAEAGFVITGSDHFRIVDVVRGLIARPAADAVGSLFQLSRLLTGAPGPIGMADAYSAGGQLDPVNGSFEANLITAADGIQIESLKYFDGETEHTISG